MHPILVKNVVIDVRAWGKIREGAAGDVGQASIFFNGYIAKINFLIKIYSYDKSAAGTTGAAAGAARTEFGSSTESRMLCLSAIVAAVDSFEYSYVFLSWFEFIKVVSVSPMSRGASDAGTFYS